MVNSDDNVSETESLSNGKASTQTIDRQMVNVSGQKDTSKSIEASTTSSEDDDKSTLPSVILSLGECVNSDDVTNKKYATGPEDKPTDPLCATDETISLLPPGLRRQDVVSNAVFPGAFRVGDPGLADDGVSRSIPGERDLSFANLGTSQSSLDQHSHNDSNLDIFSIPLEATLVTNEETREPTFVPATVNKDIVYAEILDNRIEKERELQEKEQKKKRKRVRWVVLGVLLFTFTILVSVGTTLLLNGNDDDSDVNDVNDPKQPKPENSQDRGHYYEAVTHHAVILGGQSTCTQFTPGILKLYCGGITEVHESAHASISMLDQGLQCQRIGSNSMSCNTSLLQDLGSNVSRQTGFIFSCGRKHYIDNSKVAAAAFLGASEGFECLSLNSSRVTIEDTPEAFSFVGLGHFCRAQASESDNVTWTLTDNMPMLDGKKILQCETTTAGFVSSNSNSPFDYCFQSNRSCSSNTSNRNCSSLKLGAMNATDRFDKCENKGQLDDNLFQELKLVLNEVMRENEQNLLSEIISHNMTEETR